jgi:uncharacterized protein YneF (UPF0154 family)
MEVLVTGVLVGSLIVALMVGLIGFLFIAYDQLRKD